MEDFESGKTAKNMGKSRALMFEVAFRNAIAEYDKPVEARLDWNHEEIHGVPADMSKGSSNNRGVTGNGIENTPGKKTSISNGGSGKKRKKSVQGNGKVISRRNGRDDSKEALEISKREEHAFLFKQKKASRLAANKIESTDPQRFFCRIKVLESDPYRDLEAIRHGRNIGFITLPCRKTSNFSDARKIMGEDLDEQDCTPPPGRQWKFFVPGLGKVSTKQETKLGSMFEILQNIKDDNIGDGSVSNPVSVFVFPESLNAP